MARPPFPPEAARTALTVQGWQGGRVAVAGRESDGETSDGGCAWTKGERPGETTNKYTSSQQAALRSVVVKLRTFELTIRGQGPGLVTSLVPSTRDVLDLVLNTRSSM